MSKRNPILQSLSDPGKNFLLFFLMTVLLFNLFSSGISNLFWGNFSPWFQKQIKIQDEATFQLLTLLGLFLVTLLIIFSTNLSDWVKNALADIGLTRTIVPDTARVSKLTEPCRGLIVIMSPKDDSPAEVAIRRHWNGGVAPCLEYCWIVCTQSSISFARALEERLAQEGISERLTLHYGSFEIPDPIDADKKLSLMADSKATDDSGDGFKAIHDPDRILHLVNGIYAHAESLGLSEADIIVDFTGGTKPLGVGAFLACARPERRLEYITSEDKSSEPQILEIKVAYRLKALR